MVLKLLQGPIVCTADPDDQDTAGFDVLVREETCHWLDDHAICCTSEISGYGARAGPGSTIVFNLDGVFYVRRKTANTLNPTIPGYDYITENGIQFFGFTQDAYEFEPWTGSYHETQIIAPAGDWSNDNWFRLPDRFLAWNISPGGQDDMLSCLLDEVETDLTVEYTFDPAPPALGIEHRPLRGRDSLVYLYCHDAVSTILTYDFQKRVEVLPRVTLGIAAETVLYSPKFDIFISLHENSGNQELRIWSHEGEVSALTAPVALTPITAGNVSTIQTTLTDDVGTGLPGRLIDWSITAGNGDLLGPTTPQSTTDENGIASIDYRAQITGGVDPTIQASVTF